MKDINDLSISEASAERQVLFYQTYWEEPLPGTMQEIKISIVNERAAGSKREREKTTVMTPSSKRSRHAAFSCSTPLPASTCTSASRPSDFEAPHPLRQCPDQEWDDSLLEPTEGESDSPLHMTVDEMNFHLDDDDDDDDDGDDDDSCYAAEPSKKYDGLTCVLTFTPSETEAERGGSSPCNILEVPDPLTEEPECDGDINNYAATPPSSCHPTIDPVRLTLAESDKSRICNVKSPVKSLTAKTVVPKQSFSLPRFDAAVDWSEDPEIDLDFDCEIDNILSLSPGGNFYLEDRKSGELAATTTTGNGPLISDSTLPPQGSDQVLIVQTTCSSTLDVDKKPLSLHTPDLTKVNHHPAEVEPLKETLPSKACAVAMTEPTITTESTGTEQNSVCQNPLETVESNGIQSEEFITRLTDPTPNAAQANSSQTKIVSSSSCKTQDSLAPEQEKPVVAIAAMPRPSFRAFYSDSEMEKNKNIYCERVFMHIIGHGEPNIEDPHAELALLLNKINQDNQGWKHPSDLTERNHPRVGKKPSKRCSLSQWVRKNGGSDERFRNFPNTFQRSPIPSALPFSSS